MKNKQSSRARFSMNICLSSITVWWVSAHCCLNLEISSCKDKYNEFAQRDEPATVILGKGSEGLKYPSHIIPEEGSFFTSNGDEIALESEADALDDIIGDDVDDDNNCSGAGILLGNDLCLWILCNKPGQPLRKYSCWKTKPFFESTLWKP